MLELDNNETPTSMCLVSFAGAHDSSEMLAVGSAAAGQQAACRPARPACCRAACLAPHPPLLPPPPLQVGTAEGLRHMPLDCTAGHIRIYK